MGNLLLDSLEIKGFRGYKYLKIDQFRRVNLIVGANSVGKTSLLEAIQLLIEKGHPSLIIELLNKRNEGIEMYQLGRIGRPDDEDTLKKSIKVISEGLGNMFYGRPDIDFGASQYEFTICSLHNPEQLLTIKSSWFEESEVEEEYSVEGKTLVRRRKVLIDVVEGNISPYEGNAQLGLTIQIGKQKRSYQLESYFRNARFMRDSGTSSLNTITVQGLDEGVLSTYWSQILLTDYQPNVLEAVRLISPDIKDFGFRDDERSRRKYPIVRLAGVTKPVPFHSLGEGAVRILNLILALVNSRDGVLLVDEIDTGLHHSVQVKMWDFVFRLAEQLNVQIFATTHSQDCLSAFEYIANEYRGFGQLVSLGAWQDFINATLIDERDMKIALENYVELRGAG